MKYNIRCPIPKRTALICVSNNIIKNVTTSILALTGFNSSEIIGLDLFHFFRLLKSNIVPYESHLSKTYEGYLFTKELEFKEMEVVQSPGEKEGELILKLAEKRSPALRHKLSLAKKLILDNVIPGAIFKVPDLILVISNQKFLDLIPNPYKQREYAYGCSFYSFIPEFENSKTEEFWFDCMHEGNTRHLEELKYPLDGIEDRYWDDLIIPITDGTGTQYLASLFSEVTERVMNEKKIHSHMRTIEQQKKALEVMFDNMSDSLAIIDKDGRYIKANKVFYKYMPREIAACNASFALGDSINYGIKYLDEEGVELALDQIPAARVLKGELVRQERIITKYGDREVYMDYSGTPIYDDNNNLMCGVIIARDMTERVTKQNYINQQHKMLLQSEKEKREALENAIKLKDEFLYLISHEFKTPLAVISSALQAIDMIHKNSLDLRMKSLLQTIKQNNNRQLRLVSNLLDITRINSGHIKINLQRTDIVHLTKAIIQSVQIHANEKNVLLYLESDFDSKFIYLDEEKYERILLNLLSNALKFIGTGNFISISLSSKKKNNKSMVCLTVQDDGIGIPQDKQQVIFERFGQADTNLSRQAEGTGIGLHLVKLLVNAMNGMISLKSEEGKGSTFEVLFPTAKPAGWDENNNSQSINSYLKNDDRIIQAAEIEFSDLY